MTSHTIVFADSDVKHFSSEQKEYYRTTFFPTFCHISRRQTTTPKPKDEQIAILNDLCDKLDEGYIYYDVYSGYPEYYLHYWVIKLDFASASQINRVVKALLKHQNRLNSDDIFFALAPINPEILDPISLMMIKTYTQKIVFDNVAAFDRYPVIGINSYCTALIALDYLKNILPKLQFNVCMTEYIAELEKKNKTLIAKNAEDRKSWDRWLK